MNDYLYANELIEKILFSKDSSLDNIFDELKDERLNDVQKKMINRYLNNIFYFQIRNKTWDVLSEDEYQSEIKNYPIIAARKQFSDDVVGFYSNQGERIMFIENYPQNKYLTETFRARTIYKINHFSKIYAKVLERSGRVLFARFFARFHEDTTHEYEVLKDLYFKYYDYRFEKMFSDFPREQYEFFRLWRFMIELRGRDLFKYLNKVKAIAEHLFSLTSSCFGAEDARYYYEKINTNLLGMKANGNNFLMDKYFKRIIQIEDENYLGELILCANLLNDGREIEILEVIKSRPQFFQQLKYRKLMKNYNSFVGRMQKLRDVARNNNDIIARDLIEEVFGVDIDFLSWRKPFFATVNKTSISLECRRCFETHIFPGQIYARCCHCNIFICSEFCSNEHECQEVLFDFIKEIQEDKTLNLEFYKDRIFFFHNNSKYYSPFEDDLKIFNRNNELVLHVVDDKICKNHFNSIDELYGVVNSYRIIKAIYAGDFDKLRQMRSRGVRFGEEIYMIIASTKNNLEMMKLLKDNGCPLPPQALYFSLLNSKIDQLKWLKENECKWYRGVISGEKIGPETGGYLNKGNYEVLKWCIENDCPYTKFILNTAINYEMINILELANECKYGELTDNSYEICNSIEMMKWLREKNIEWTTSTCNSLARWKSFELFKWAHENGCPWDPVAFSLAAANEDWRTLMEYFRENDLPHSKYVCCHAAFIGNLEALKWLCDRNYTLNIYSCYEAREKGHLHILKYLHENNCPCIHTELNSKIIENGESVEINACKFMPAI